MSKLVCQHKAPQPQPSNGIRLCHQYHWASPYEFNGHLTSITNLPKSVRRVVLVNRRYRSIGGCLHRWRHRAISVAVEEMAVEAALTGDRGWSIVLCCYDRGSSCLWRDQGHGQKMLNRARITCRSLRP